MGLDKLKKNIAGIVTALVCAALNACSSADDSDGRYRVFNATDLTDYSNYTVSAELVYNGSYCKVYKDVDDGYMSDSDASAMGQEFDANIYDKIVASFGIPADVDEDGKITLLVLDIRDEGDATSYVAGYFYPLNEFSSAYTETQYSNECDMIYMDSNPGAGYPEVFRQTMAHEFQHLINFWQKVAVQDSSTGFDTWIDEGLSSAAERIYSGAQIGDKIAYFNEDPYHDIARGQRFIAWDKGTYNSVYGNYSMVYLFFQWLNIQSENDNSIYKIIMNNNNVDYNAVYASESHLASFTGSSFPDLLRDWNIANLLSRDSGIYGYKGEISATAHYINDSTDNPSYTSGSTRDMMAGECIYAKITGSYTLGATDNISGTGVNTATYVIDTTGTEYSGNVLLVYNTASSDSDAVSATGTLPGKVLSVSSLQSVARSYSAGKRYPVDKVFKFNGTNFKK